MYDSDLNEPAKAMTSDLNEELGQVCVQIFVCNAFEVSFY